MHTSKDPTLITALLEDSAAIIGLLIALCGVALGHRFENPHLDGSASIAIGLLLAAVAAVLAYESKGLLVGEGVQPGKLAAIRALIEADPSVEEAVRVLTMHFGPQKILLNLDPFSTGPSNRGSDRGDRADEQKISSRREPHLCRNRVAIAEAPRRPAATACEWRLGKNLKNLMTQSNQAVWGLMDQDITSAQRPEI